MWWEDFTLSSPNPCRPFWWSWISGSWLGSWVGDRLPGLGVQDHRGWHTAPHLPILGTAGLHTSPKMSQQMSHLCRLPLEGVTAKWLNFSPLLRTIHCIISNLFALTLGNQDVNIFYGRQRATSIVREAPLYRIVWILGLWLLKQSIPGPLYWGSIPRLHFAKNFCQTGQRWHLAFQLNSTFGVQYLQIHAKCPSGPDAAASNTSLSTTTAGWQKLTGFRQTQKCL